MERGQNKGGTRIGPAAVVVLQKYSTGTAALSLSLESPGDALVAGVVSIYVYMGWVGTVYTYLHYLHKKVIHALNRNAVEPINLRRRKKRCRTDNPSTKK